VQSHRCLVFILGVGAVAGCERAAPVGGSTTDRQAAAQQGDGQPGTAADPPTDPAWRQAAAPSPPHTVEPANSAIPSRRNPVGHAIALASIRSLNTDKKLQISIMDPADNETAKRRGAEADREMRPPHHDWLPAPHRIDVRWGRQRPAIALREGRFFTIVGAVLIRPAAAVARPAFNASAARMPDFSQHLQPDWPGLCAAAAAADVLYQIGHRDPAIIAGNPFGPAAAADRDADRLIAGTSGLVSQPGGPSPFITANSLAGRMGNRQGTGATALGIVTGLRSWIKDHGGDAWRADLAFLDDAPGERSAADQQAWFGSLGAAISGGGGGLLLLWEGADWADRRMGEQEDGSQDADPRFPPLPHGPAVAQGQPAHPGGSLPGDQDNAPLANSESPHRNAAVQALNRDLQKAKEALADGRYDTARQIATQVLEAGLAIRFEEPGVEMAIEAARSITAQSDRAEPRKSRARDGIRTRYDG